MGFLSYNLDFYRSELQRLESGAVTDAGLYRARQLLRDALLPFVYYLARGRARIYPWLLSRASLAALTGRENADDELRASVYRTLEAGCTDIRSFAGIVLPEMRRTISRYP